MFPLKRLNHLLLLWKVMFKENREMRNLKKWWLRRWKKIKKKKIIFLLPLEWRGWKSSRMGKDNLSSSPPPLFLGHLLERLIIVFSPEKMIISCRRRRTTQVSGGERKRPTQSKGARTRSKTRSAYCFDRVRNVVIDTFQGESPWAWREWITTSARSNCKVLFDLKPTLIS